jgi:hypothetical protein
MDPDEALKQIREVVSKIRNDETARTLDAYAELETITDAFEALDDWLSSGGFLPKDWAYSSTP